MRIAGHPYHKLICHETLLSNPGRCICIMGISREACKSILSFLKDVIDLATSEAGSAFRPHLKEALSARGPALFRLLIAACTGALPESRNYDVSSLSQERKSTRLVVPNVFSLRARISFNSSSCPGFHGEVLLVFQVSELLHALTSCIGQPALTWLHDSLNAIPPQCASNEDKAQVMQALMLATSSSKDSNNNNRLFNAIEDLSGSCRRTKRTLDATQSALLGQRVS